MEPLNTKDMLTIETITLLLLTKTSINSLEIDGFEKFCNSVMNTIIDVEIPRMKDVFAHDPSPSRLGFVRNT